MFNTLYLRLAGLALIAALIGGTYWHISNLKADLKDKTEQVTVLQGKLQTSEENLKEVTVTRDNFQAQLTSAEQARKKVQSDLQVALLKLRSQKPPTECKAAIDWSVDMKDDLNWSPK
jgi:chromosome segregation ATPase